jgi:hypothetical protein
MDQSFDAFGGNTGGYQGNGWGGGGAGDTSFAATQATPKGIDYDRVALPVTVATLNNLESTAEKIQYGNYSFSQVRVVAEVVSVSETESKETRYMVRDYGNEDQTPFLIVQYSGIDTSTAPPFIEGTIVHAIGKIRTFDGQSAILAFKVLEVPDTHMHEVFPKEARVAELYFTKNVPDMYASGDMSNFVGTFLSPEPPQTNNRTNTAALGTPSRNLPLNNYANAATLDGDNGASIYGSTQRPGKGSNPQQNKILQYFENHPSLSSDEGISAATIRAAIGGNARFDDDINELASNGVIYTTIDDNHFALVTE